VPRFVRSHTLSEPTVWLRAVTTAHITAGGPPAVDLPVAQALRRSPPESA